MSLLPIVLLSSLIGAIVGGAVLAMRGQDRTTPIPFGPFIAAAGWVWFLPGDRLGALVRGLLRSADIDDRCGYPPFGSHCIIVLAMAGDLSTASVRCIPSPSH